ncbi:Uncharacterised BCR, YbaB family COG0718 [Mycolicibacterium fortuitum]|uniref:Uncharacterized BCR, YbaB family COG0718 n=1 Tax=Mycolicibacterium fortuitum TaxID=1766 RepID=A0A378WE44_MYCFO|nr:Uncharacterised BCR, YbaB family COG0718 [Mycolicibacterium fortuitum]
MPDDEDRIQSSHRDAFNLDELLSNVQKFQQSVAGSSQRLALEVVDAWSKDDLVRVWVNAQGLVIQAEVDETEFRSATPESLSAAFVEASHTAANKMRQKTEAFQAELRQKLSALAPNALPDLADIEELRSVQPTVPTSPPGSKERKQLATALSDDADSAAPQTEHSGCHNAVPQGPDDWDDDFTLRA